MINSEANDYFCYMGTRGPTCVYDGVDSYDGEIYYGYGGWEYAYVSYVYGYG